MWIEVEKMSMTNVEDCAQIVYMMGQIEASLTEKHSQLYFQPNVSLPSLGSLDETLSDSMISNIVQTTESLSESKIISERLTDGHQESNEKQSNNRIIVSSVNAKSENEMTNTQQNKKQVKSNKSLADCNKTTTSTINEQNEDPTLTTNFHTTFNQSNQSNLENFSIVWLNPSIKNIESDKLTSSKTHLRRIVNYLRIFDRLEPCVEYINENVDEKIFLILSASLCQQVLPIVTELEQIVSIYILLESSMNKIQIKQKYENKIAGKYGDINSVCNHLKQAVLSLSNNVLKINVLSLCDSLLDDDNDTDMKASFVFANYRVERLLSTIVKGQNNKKHLIDECRLLYAGNDDQLKLTEEFYKDYHSDKAIWWYTRKVFLTDILNRGVRIKNHDILTKLKFFIFDLHQQIEHLYSQSLQMEPSIVYFGQNLSNEELDKLKMNVDGFLMANNFLLTYTCRDTALSSITPHGNLRSVLFQIKIDPSVNTKAPYAAVQQFNYSQNEEVLFSICSVFKIKGIRKIRDDIWNVILLLCEKEQERLEEIDNIVKEAVLSKSANVHVIDNNKRFYEITFLNDNGIICNYSKETHIYATKLDFEQLKNRPRMVIDIKDGHDVLQLCPSTKSLLCYCSNKNIYIIDRNGNIINRTKWMYGYIYDICWSSLLNKFIIVADSPTFSFYTYDENTNEIQHVEQQCYTVRIKSYENCACFERSFMLGYHTINWGLQICTFDVEKWELVGSTFHEETLNDMRFAMTTFIWIGITKREWSKSKDESGHWRFELRDIESISTVRRAIQIDNILKSPCTVSLSNAEWLIYDKETKLLNLINRTARSQTSVEYSESIRYATLMDRNCFVILTKNNQLHFHDL
ncbi:unnamed protein product [Adineta steineri]|uniref:Uncharacterized protein n=1 Tax=Adineta steineri TaxID=433720 RepID=A0A815AYP6_9BILA|nr:unnamed protein product [Adineta steineri]CAF1552723.1 unnamed protein product [Adineta steineri]